MAQHLKDGAESLNQGYQTFSTALPERGLRPGCEEGRAQHREDLPPALADLFDVEQHVAEMETMDGHSAWRHRARSWTVFKKREVYRHMSNAAGPPAGAGSCRTTSSSRPSSGEDVPTVHATSSPPVK